MELCRLETTETKRYELVLVGSGCLYVDEMDEWSAFLVLLGLELDTKRTELGVSGLGVVLYGSQIHKYNVLIFY